MEKDAVYVRCESKEVDSGDMDTVSFKYFGGTDGNLESKYYPFTGKKAQPNYEQPIVAVRINGLKVRDTLKRFFLRFFFSLELTLESTAELSPRTSPSMTETTLDPSPSR